MTCRACNGSGYEFVVLSHYGEPQDWRLEPCDCVAGRRVAKRERWERYQERLEAKRSADRGLPTFNPIGF